MNRIFMKIFERKVENFINYFLYDSEVIFHDKNDKLYHPGEFGRYREKALIQLIETLLKSKFKITDGFIITSTDKVSSQCDVIIYDYDNCIILNDDITQFIPVESVVAIGEVKSTLTKKQFEKALIKLAKNKELRDEANGLVSYSIIPNTFLTDTFNPRLNNIDQNVSFLVCKKLDFDFRNFDFDKFYTENSIEHRNRHNMILSLCDGLFIYEIESEKEENNGKTIQYPRFAADRCIDHIVNFNSNYNFRCYYVKRFCWLLEQAISITTLIKPDISFYGGLQELDLLDEDFMDDFILDT